MLDHDDSMEEAATNDITVRAEVRLLPTSESGRTVPIRGSYRPNHNFFGPDNRTMAVGSIDLPAGSELRPGEATEVTITFFAWPSLAPHIYPGREWRIQEGGRLVAIGRVIEVLS